MFPLTYYKKSCGVGNIYIYILYTGRFIMFPLTYCKKSCGGGKYIYIYIIYRAFHNVPLITNVYYKKTKGPTLMELFRAKGKMNFFLTTRDVRCVHHWWHGTHRYDIQVLATHASTWVHRYSSLLQWIVALGQRGHVAMVLSVLCTKCTLRSNHRLTRVIFQHTKRLLPRSGHFLTTYTGIA